MRVLFTVQGEGRGHLSQAIAMAELLRDAGHELCGVLVGGDPDRALPAYFAEEIGFEPGRFLGPGTVPASRRRRISHSKTTARTLRQLPRYRQAIRRLRREIRTSDPDLIVNFYDALSGLAVRGMGREAPPFVAVGHHFLLGHPGAARPPFRPVQLAVLRATNRLAAPSGVLRLALSFRALSDGPTPHTRVVPPLIRRAILDSQATTGAHILVYVLHEGYGHEVARWHAAHPEVPVQLFWDREGAPEEERIRPNLTFHRLSGARFLEAMRSCRAYAGTAGFEAVAEALWLGKPVMVVPTAGHIEQAWNAREALAAGAGIASERFDLGLLLDHMPGHRSPTPEFRKWVESGHPRILRILEDAAGRR